MLRQQTAPCSRNKPWISLIPQPSSTLSRLQRTSSFAQTPAYHRDLHLLQHTKLDADVGTSALESDSDADSEGKEDRDDWKLWYLNLDDWDFLSKSFSAEAASPNQLVEVEQNTVSASNVTMVEEPLRNLPPSRASHFLYQLRQDLGMLELRSKSDDLLSSTKDAKQRTTLVSELNGLQAIVITNVETGTEIPKALQQKLISRLERMVIAVELRQQWDRSYVMVDLGKQANLLVRIFVQLLNPMRTCVVCSTEDRSSTYKAMITACCEHDTHTCSDCLQTWIISQLVEKGWDKIRCTECPQLLGHSDVKASVTEEVFRRYDYLATRAVLAATKEFRWCLNPDCSAGQIHTGGANFNCHSCNYQYCVKHCTAWHQNETCDQYDNRRHSAKLHDKASEEWKTQQTKICSKCSVVIEKNGGCDHMTCSKCYASFSWDGAESYAAQEYAPPDYALLAAPKPVEARTETSKRRLFWALARRSLSLRTRSVTQERVCLATR